MQLLGHRGAKGEAPENTLKAIKHALDLGLTAIEIDVHLSQDDELVVIHDPRVDRTTNGSGKVRDLSLEQLRSLDAGEGEKIPTLTEVMDLIENHKAEILIEIKAPACEAPVVAEIQKRNYQERSAVICFNHRILQLVKAIDPNVRTACLLFGLPVDPVGMIRACGADGLSICTETVDKQLVDDCKKAGLFVGVWNVNEKVHLPYFVDMGVELIGTDYPSRLLYAE